MQAHFTLIDWLVLIAYMVGTTLLGARLAGKQSTIREFFLAGRKIPWLAVAGSNIATEISAVTLISVPAIVFKPGGDLTYLQMALGALLARVIVGIWFVRVFYEREIYSPYDYMGAWLGPHAKAVTSGLFVLGAVLGQSVRVLLTALVLELITGIPLTVSIWLIGVIAVVWTLLGGITTVIWTDVIQFIVFLGSLLIALAFVLGDVPGGWGEIWRQAASAPEGSKLRFWDFSSSLAREYTFWTALVANTVVCLAAYGTDQMMAQRMFCCRGRREATWAVLASSGALVIPAIAAAVGLGLYAYYQHNPLSGETLALVQERNDRVFPVYVLTHLPVGVVGVVIAGIFAAAISTLDSVLVALAQVVVTGAYRPWRARRIGPARDDEQHYVNVAKGLVLFWAVVLCAMAQVSTLALIHYRDILNLALAMATYTGGPMLAAFTLAFFRVPVDARGIVWGTPMAILVVFAIAWPQPWAQPVVVWMATGLVGLWVLVRIRRREPLVELLFGAALYAALAVLGVLINRATDSSGGPLKIAFPWNVPIGYVVALTLGWALARRRSAPPPEPAP